MALLLKSNNSFTGSKLDLLEIVAITSPVASVATSRVIDGYSGAILQVRKPDGTSKDMFAGADGKLLDSELLAFAQGGDLYVGIMYDQTGNGNDFSRANASITTTHPYIIKNGNIVKDSTGKLSIDYSNTGGLVCKSIAPTLMESSAYRITVEADNNSSYPQFGDYAVSVFYRRGANNGVIPYTIETHSDSAKLSFYNKDDPSRTYVRVDATNSSRKRVVSVTYIKTTNTAIVSNITENTVVVKNDVQISANSYESIAIGVSTLTYTETELAKFNGLVTSLSIASVI